MNQAKEEWIYTQTLGTLFVEIVLVFFDVPELFVCTDNDGHRYLVVFVDDDSLRYVAVPISDEVLVAMLQGKITMKQAFLLADGGVAFNIYKDFDADAFIAQQTTIQAVPAEDLPNDDGYYHMRTRDVIQYCEQLQRRSAVDELQMTVPPYHWTEHGSTVSAMETCATSFLINIKLAPAKSVAATQYDMFEVFTYGEESVPIFQPGFENTANAA